MGNKFDMDKKRLVTGHTLMRALTFAMQDDKGLGLVLDYDATIALLLPVVIIDVWEHIDEAIKEEEDENHGKTED